MSADVLGDCTEAWLMTGLGICADKEYMLEDRPRPGTGTAASSTATSRASGPAAIRPSTRPCRSVKAQRYDRNNILIHGKGFAVLSALETGLSSGAGRSSTGSGIARAAREFSRPRRLRLAGVPALWPRPSRGRAWTGSARIGSGPARPWNAASCPRLRRRPQADSLRKSGGTWNELHPHAGARPGRVRGRRRPRRDDRPAEQSGRDVLRFSSHSPLREVVLDPDRRLESRRGDPSPERRGDRRPVEALDWTGTGAAALEFFKDPATGPVRVPHVCQFKLGLLLFDGGTCPEVPGGLPEVP
ncbi:MAG: hypothetical protein MZV63_63265 [Marinilabiliales bacterium]|nr:hypothetical protein [Marinilabiliales bacterium]